MSITLDRIQFYAPPAPRSSQVTSKGAAAHLAAPAHPQRPRPSAPALRQSQLVLARGQSVRDAIEVEDDSASDTSSGDDADAQVNSSEPATRTVDCTDASLQPYQDRDSTHPIREGSPSSLPSPAFPAQQFRWALNDLSPESRASLTSRSASPIPSPENAPSPNKDGVAGSATSDGAEPAQLQYQRPHLANGSVQPRFQSGEEAPEHPPVHHDPTPASPDTDMEELDRMLDGLIDDRDSPNLIREIGLGSRSGSQSPIRLSSPTSNSVPSYSKQPALSHGATLAPTPHSSPRTPTNSSSDARDQASTGNQPRTQKSVKYLLPPPKIKRTRRPPFPSEHVRRSSARLRAIAAARNKAEDHRQQQQQHGHEHDASCSASLSEGSSDSDEDYGARYSRRLRRLRGRSSKSTGPKLNQYSPRRPRDRAGPDRRTSRLSPMRPPGSAAKEAGTSGYLSPQSSHIPSDQESYQGGSIAVFSEWPLDNVILKRVMVGGTAKFQLEFNYDSKTELDHLHASDTHVDASKRKATGIPTEDVARSMGSKRRKRSPRTGTPFSADEENYLVHLRKERLSWKEIHKKFERAYPGRSIGSLQVYYSTRVKRRPAIEV